MSEQFLERREKKDARGAARDFDDEFLAEVKSVAHSTSLELFAVTKFGESMDRLYKLNSD